MTQIVNASDADFEDKVLNQKGIVVVDFWAPWCGPCLMLSPILEKLADEYANDVQFVKLNVDENPKTAQRYGVMSIPTIAIFEDGRLMNQIVGVRPAEVYKREIESLLNATQEEKEARQKAKQVVVFSTPTCPWCNKLKAYLKEKGIQFKDVDVSKDAVAAQAMVARSGQMGVPQVWINGQVVVGFNKPLIDELLGIKG